MTESFDFILKNGTCVTPWNTVAADVAVKDGKIAGIGSYDAGRAGETIDCTGLHVLPGIIDTQVHFREPGLTHKEDLESGSRAAAMGGVTAVFEMPNTKPPTTSVEALAEKVRLGTDRMHTDFAFYGGGTAENAETLPQMERAPGCCGIKIFMGSSTGNLLVADDDSVRSIFRNLTRRPAVHSEDEFRLRERREFAELGKPETHPVWRDELTAIQCTERLLRIARECGKTVHVLHITTAQEAEILAANKDIATMEVLPQHLTLAAPECYERLGTFAQMNPPIRDAHHREALWQAVNQGVVDIVGSDHAAHTVEEKEQPYPKSPAGLPGVQTIVPLMLTHVNEGRLTLERFVDLMAHGPQRVFGIVNKGRLVRGYDADFTIVDMKAERTIEKDWLESKCGWSPFEGMTAKGWPKGTILRGRKVMWEDELVGPSRGRPIRFWSNLSD